MRGTGSGVVAGVMLASLLWAGASEASPPSSFEEAKVVLYEQVYRGKRERVEIYCGCAFGHDRRIDPSSCGVGGKELGQGSDRIWIEHALPVSWAQFHFACYREGTRSEGGRRDEDESPRAYCGRVDAGFALMEADLHNLWPSVGSINKIRGASAYGMVAGEPREYGSCDFEKADKRAEPREAVRGDLARSVLYMRDRYKVRISERDQKVLEAWDRQDPVDEWEIERNRRIRSIQGNGNPWIERRAGAARGTRPSSRYGDLRAEDATWLGLVP